MRKATLVCPADRPAVTAIFALLGAPHETVVRHCGTGRARPAKMRAARAAKKT